MSFVKKLVKQLAGQSYPVAKALWKRSQRRNLQSCSGQPVINYQMGKVGSSTIQASLEALKLNHSIYHVHFLNPVRVKKIELQRKRHFRTEKYAYLRRPWLSEFLYEEIQKKNRKWKIVSLARDPIARNISTFFENLEVSKKSDESEYKVNSDYYGFNIEVSINDLQPLIALFFDRLEHDRPLHYFDDEVNAVFGIDIYKTAFSQEAGYVICRDDELYSQFKRTIRLPQRYIDRMYESTYARYFYSEQEIQDLRKKWGAHLNG